MLVAGDIGGTKTNLALFDESVSDFSHFEAFQTFASSDFPDLETLLQTYLKDKEVTHACFAVAGPVVDGVCRATNLPWIIDAKKIARACHLSHVCLINDLFANGEAIAVLDETMIATLHMPAEKESGNRAIISAGTGLGEAGLFWDTKRYHVFASEGGHTDFAPVNELQVELFNYLHEKFGHVSYERVLSGSGFLNLFQFLVDVKKRKVPEWLTHELEKRNHAAVITEKGLSEKSELCIETLDLFTEIYGQESGNLALKFMALGGLYIGGGIAPKILSKLKEPIFLRGFFNKGRFETLLTKVPVHVILDEKAALKGAALTARKQYDSCKV